MSKEERDRDAMRDWGASLYPKYKHNETGFQKHAGFDPLKVVLLLLVGLYTGSHAVEGIVYLLFGDN
jgi:hypothetical protein